MISLKAFILAGFIFFSGHWTAMAQYSRFVVQLRDKQSNSYQLSNPSAFLTQGSLNRRAKQHLSLDSTDLPISPVYLEAIASVPQVSILNYSKWLNQVLVKVSDPAALENIGALPFVLRIEPIALRTGQPRSDSLRNMINKSEVYLEKLSTTAETGINGSQSPNGSLGNAINYGISFAQIHIHEGEYLHNLGFKGQHMIIAVLDAGFHAYLTNPAFDSLLLNNRILGTYDFVSQKQSVYKEDEHGAYCLSVLAANEPGSMTGSAPGASYFLLRTEDVNSEFPVEEQNWAAAAEYADSAGADLISTSLGYDNYDDPNFDHPYADRNGHTTIITRAANLAVAKGMIVTASAGNSGLATNDSKFIGCPADGDSVITIGATDLHGKIADFSSWGPSSSGQLKPDFVSIGQNTVVAQTDGVPALANGTSFSNPNLAGLIACLWQAFPEFNNHDILEAARKSADRYNHPDNRYGYGFPNFRIAYEILQEKRMTSAFANAAPGASLLIYPVPFRDQLSVIFKPAITGMANLILIDAVGRVIDSKHVAVTANQPGSVHFTLPYSFPDGMYLVRYDDGHTRKTLKSIKL